MLSASLRTGIAIEISGSEASWSETVVFMREELESGAFM